MDKKDPNACNTDDEWTLQVDQPSGWPIVREKQQIYCLLQLRRKSGNVLDP